MTQPLFCIKHEKMVLPETFRLSGYGHAYVAETEPGLPELNFCEFPDGYAAMPPPETEQDWEDHMSQPSDEELEFMDMEAYL